MLDTTVCMCYCVNRRLESLVFDHQRSPQDEDGNALDENR